MSEAAKSAVLSGLRRSGGLLAAVGGLGLLAGLVFDRAQFFRSYLLGFLFVALLAIGCLGLALLSQLTGGLWGLVPRRLHEAAARTLPWLGLLFVPVLIGMGSLYPWAHAEAVQNDALLREKALYLNPGFFALRAAFYFAVWGLLAYAVSAWSRQQDREPLESRASRLRTVSAVGLVALFLTATFAAVDWGMSLAPHWYSTLYGVLFIVAAGLGALSLTIVLLARLSAEEPWRTAVTPTTVHDLGKLLLAFTMLWGYVNFSQFLIIWSGNISEETPFYVRRLHGAWQSLAVALVVFHFALPFALLLSRALKRNARALARVAGLMLLMQLADLYWLVGPDLAGHGGVHAAFRPHPLDLAAVLGLFGLWLVLLVRQLDGAALLPLGEPQIRELTSGALSRAQAEAH